MPTWGEILEELNEQPQVKQGGNPDFDVLRRKYLAELHQLTGRPVIIYYSDFLGGNGPGIGLEDMQSMMECCRGITDSDALDLILHSPGGSAEDTASIVHYLRELFDEIRVFVPLAAMSAATMWSCACDEIVMGKHSQLGPIDPQLLTPNGAVPVRAILDQFERAVEECASDPQRLAAWAPILQQYGPALLEQSENAQELAERLVKQWLAEYMFKDRDDAADLATQVASHLADHSIHQSHSLGITRDKARDLGLVVADLEADKDLQDAILSVHHATLLTLQGPCIKLAENHLGKGVFRLDMPVMLSPQPQQMVPAQLPSPLIPPPTA